MHFCKWNIPQEIYPFPNQVAPLQLSFSIQGVLLRIKIMLEVLDLMPMGKVMVLCYLYFQEYMTQGPPRIWKLHCKWNHRQSFPNWRCPNIRLLANLGYNLPHIIMHALNNITNTDVFEMKSVTSTTNTHTHNSDWPTFKKFGTRLDRITTLLTFFRKHNMCQHCNKWWLHLYIQHCCC